MMITANNGFIEQSERYAFNNAGESLKKYILLKKGELAYNHGASKLRPYGSCFALTTAENARIPFVYHCFSAENQNAEFMSIELNGAEIENQLRKIVSSGARMDGLLNISFDEYTSVSVLLPNTEEQDRIADFFRQLDHLITLHQRKFEKLTNVKKSMLEKMFPQNGSRYPEIRFKGFTDPWEQRKFSELVQIERGGSPRPIDDFITDAPNGLNWVKIGDAPTQGNYITKTAEKIRPEGLSKTREVHPGDLILSNSMSFGKPYIMGIDGCIHDGWLLIRNTYGVFDLTFLCHLLGTPQMLGQYRSLAAGSTVNNLNKELVGNTVVTIPSITEQRVLGDYLEQLDHLITLHQRQPFLHSTPEISLTLQLIHPFYTSSWEQRKWINTVDISTNMVDPKSGKYDLLPHVAPGNIESFTGRLYDNVKLVGEENLISGKFVFNVGDIVYGKINPQLGKYVFARFSGLTSADAYVLNAKNGIVQKFLYAVIQTRDFYDYSVSVSKRSGMPKINRDELNAYSYWAPSESEQLKIGEYLLTLDHLITLHQRELEKLQNIKKSMLEKMFV